MKRSVRNPLRDPPHTKLQVAKFGDKPALVSLYSKAAALAFDPVFKTTGEVSYEASLGQVYAASTRRFAAPPE